MLLHRPTAESSFVTERTTKRIGAAGGSVPPVSPIPRAYMAFGLDANLVVTILRKRPPATFAGRIGVGRTRATDIHIADEDISRYHAYFEWSERDGAHMLVDAGSTNGTFVDGRRLSPKEGIPILDGAIVTFANYHFRFQTAVGFYDVLGEVAFAGRKMSTRPAGTGT